MELQGMKNCIRDPENQQENKVFTTDRHLQLHSYIKNERKL